MAVTEPYHERSLGELFGSLTGEVKQLVQQEVRLAKVEVGYQLSTAARNIALMLVGSGVLSAGFLTLMLALVGLLGHAFDLSWWQAGVGVGVVAVGLGGAIAGLGQSALRAQNFTLEQTVTSLKEDATWIKEQVNPSPRSV